MAGKDEKNKPEEGGAEQQAPAPKKSKLPIIIILIVVLLGGGGAGGYFFFFKHKAPAGEEQKEGEHEGAGEEGGKADSKAMGLMVELDPFLVNLDEPGTTRYLKTGIQLEVTDAKAEEEIKARKVQLRDLILTYLSSLNYSQTQGTVNKDIIRNALTKKITEKLGAGKVKGLYFTDFVIQ